MNAHMATQGHATLQALGLAALVAFVLGVFGPSLDNRSYSSYGYTGDAPDTAAESAGRAVALSQAADSAHCAALHGPQAVAIQLPDGQHRCADKRGRMVRSVITIAHPTSH